MSSLSDVLNLVKNIPAILRNVYCNSTCCGGVNRNEYNEDISLNTERNSKKKKTRRHHEKDPEDESKRS